MSFIKRVLSSLPLLPVTLAANPIPPGVLRYTPTDFQDYEVYLARDLASFVAYHDEFFNILGPSPSLQLILNSSFAQFHEAGIFMTNGASPELWVTSNQYNITDSPDTNNKAVAISRVTSDGSAWQVEVINPTTLHPLKLANGGARFSEDSIVLLDQGSLSAGGGVNLMNTTFPYETQVVVNSYLGIELNSPNDIFVTKDKAIWFTDPYYGMIQGIRPEPLLPSHLYRYVPGTTEIRAMMDGLVHPNGVTFSPDEQTVYVTDGAADVSVGTNPRAIYAFDVNRSFDGNYHLSGKRLFAVPQVGIPDGIKVDTYGNLYAGCGDGLNVWNAGGVLLGKVIVDGGVANFAIGDAGQLFLLAEDRLYLAQVNEAVSMVRDS